MSVKRDDIDDDEVWYKYNVENMTQQEIADYYGVSRGCIYWRLHPDKMKVNYSNRREYAKEYEQSESGKARRKRFALSDKGIEWRKRFEQTEKAKARIKKFQQTDKGKACTKRYRESENGKVYIKEWWQSDKGKELMRKRHAERRELGSTELNKPFPNSEGHHIDEEYIIHMPKELHRSIYHNLKTGQGMEEINTIAFGYISEETFDKLLAGEI